MKVKRIVALSAVLAVVALTLGGCSREPVPPAHYGKILSSDGYSPELLDVGKHWLMWWNDLVLVDGSTNTVPLPAKVTMSEYDDNDNQSAGLGMDFIMSIRYRMRPDAAVVQSMFSTIKVNPEVGVTAAMMFNIYAKPLIMTEFRELMSPQTPEQAFANRGALSKEFGKRIETALVGTPIQLELALITAAILPPVIVARIEATKNTELMQAQENEAQKVKLIKANNLVTLERLESERKLTAAQGEAAANAALLLGLEPEVLELRRLEIQKITAEGIAARMASQQPGDVVFIPFDSISSTGAQMRMFNTTAK